MATPVTHPPTTPPPANDELGDERGRRPSERTTLHAGPMTALPQRPEAARPTVKKLARPSSGLATRRRTEGTGPHGPTPEELASGAPIRCLVFAPEPNRARWVETELTQANPSVLEGAEPRPKITIQLGRRVRTVVCALVKDPPPRPQVLIVDFDAISAGELFELHAVRHEGWTGRLIGLGDVPPELVTSLEVDHVFTAPFVRDSLLDCVAGTTHAAITALIPVIPEGQDTF
jgi:hypothetical protein